MPARNRTQIIAGDNDCFLLLRIVKMYLQYCLRIVPQDNVEWAFDQPILSNSEFKVACMKPYLFTSCKHLQELLDRLREG